jgi:transcriptional regulator with XRE-family HTH domain
MPPPSTVKRRERDEVLAHVLKAIRQHRRMTVLQVADLMGMRKRSYERFEAGEGLLKVERVFAFSRATDSDPYALWASVKLGAPDFALACIDNKLVLLFVAHARELFQLQGADLGDLQPQAIVEALGVAFAMMTAELDRARTSAARWLGGSGSDGGDD